jgi:anti-sigma B factor antagonist
MPERTENNPDGEKSTSETRIKSESKYDLLFRTAAYQFSKSGSFSHDIIEDRQNDVAIISVNQYRANFLTAPELKNYLFRVIERGEKKVLVDLQQCRRIDSTYLGALVASLRKIAGTGGDLRLICNQAIFSWLFVITKMDKVFRIFTNLEDGIKSFGS